MQAWRRHRLQGPVELESCVGTRRNSQSRAFEKPNGHSGELGMAGNQSTDLYEVCMPPVDYKAQSTCKT